VPGRSIVFINQGWIWIFEAECKLSNWL